MNDMNTKEYFEAYFSESKIQHMSDSQIDDTIGFAEAHAQYQNAVLKDKYDKLQSSKLAEGFERINDAYRELEQRNAELEKYIEHLESKAENLPISSVGSRFVRGPHIQNELLCGYCTGTGLDAGSEVCKPCIGSGLESQKIITMWFLRSLEFQVNNEEITYSKMVETLNVHATEFMYEWIKERIVAREKLKERRNGRPVYRTQRQEGGEDI